MIYGIEDMAKGDCLFAATGVTTGSLLSGVKFRKDGVIETETVVMRSVTGTVRHIQAEHRAAGEVLPGLTTSSFRGPSRTGTSRHPTSTGRRAAPRATAPGMTTRTTKEAPMSDLSAVKALVFDVFGTVVDWRTSLITDLMWWSRDRGVTADWTALVDGWRGMYMASMDDVRKHPERGYVILDDLHRRSLEKLVETFAIKGLTEADLDYITRGWHRLHPWPDSVAGPDLAEIEIRDLAAVERQRRAAHQHGEVRRPPLGPHRCRRNCSSTTSPIPRPISAPRACSVSGPSR